MLWSPDLLPLPSPWWCLFSPTDTVIAGTAIGSGARAPTGDSDKIINSLSLELRQLDLCSVKASNGPSALAPAGSRLSHRRPRPPFRRVLVLSCPEGTVQKQGGCHPSSSQPVMALIRPLFPQSSAFLCVLCSLSSPGLYSAVSSPRPPSAPMPLIADTCRVRTSL